jgi:hypothetical protein
MAVIKVVCFGGNDIATTIKYLDVEVSITIYRIKL